MMQQQNDEQMKTQNKISNIYKYNKTKTKNEKKQNDEQMKMQNKISKIKINKTKTQKTKQKKNTLVHLNNLD